MESGRQRSKVKTLSLQRCALRKFHMKKKNTHDQITSDRKSKRAWADCFLCIPFIFSIVEVQKKLATYVSYHRRPLS